MQSDPSDGTCISLQNSYDREEVYSDVESQDRNFNKFNDLFNFIIIFDEKQNQNKGKVSPLQILALTELLGKFILLSKDI